MDEIPRSFSTADEWDSLYESQPMAWRGSTSIHVPLASGDRVLEAGCGNGKTIQALIGEDIELHAVDISEVALRRCRARFSHGVNLDIADIRDLPYRNGHFNVIIAVHVLSHLSYSGRKRAAGEITRCLAPGGYVFIRGFDRRDMRYGKGEEIEPHTFLRGNGISYHHIDDDEVIAFFPFLEPIECKHGEEEKRFHGKREVRSWTDLLLRSRLKDD